MPIVIRSYKFAEIAQGQCFKIPDGRAFIKLNQPTPAGETACMIAGSVPGKLSVLVDEDLVEPLVLSA